MSLWSFMGVKEIVHAFEKLAAALSPLHISSFYLCFLVWTHFSFILVCNLPLYRFPLSACSRSIASNKLLKLPAPKPSNSLRWMISMKTVGRSIRGLVKSWSR